MVRDSSNLPRWSSLVSGVQPLSQLRCRCRREAIRDFWYRTQTLTGDRVISAAIVSEKKYLTCTCNCTCNILEKLHHQDPIEAIRNFWFSPHDQLYLQQVVAEVKWSSFETLIVWQWKDTRGGFASYLSVKLRPIFDNAPTVLSTRCMKIMTSLVSSEIAHKWNFYEDYRSDKAEWRFECEAVQIQSHWKHQERRLGKQSCVVTLVLQPSSDIIWGVRDS